MVDFASMGGPPDFSDAEFFYDKPTRRLSHRRPRARLIDPHIDDPRIRHNSDSLILLAVDLTHAELIRGRKITQLSKLASAFHLLQCRLHNRDFDASFQAELSGLQSRFSGRVSDSKRRLRAHLSAQKAELADLRGRGGGAAARRGGRAGARGIEAEQRESARAQGGDGGRPSPRPPPARFQIGAPPQKPPRKVFLQS
jgi:hypothetical protein